jgi:ribosomal-protein-alanine N-acetyltransferase
MRAADLDDVVRISRSTMLHPWSRNQFAEELIRPRGKALVACAGGLCGYVFFRFIDQEAELLQLAVKPSRMGQGIGGQLLSTGIKQLASRGVMTCFLEVRKENVRARRFYQRHGFVAIGRREKYYRLPVDDAIVMKKRRAGDGSDADNT